MVYLTLLLYLLLQLSAEKITAFLKKGCEHPNYFFAHERNQLQ